MINISFIIIYFVVLDRLSFENFFKIHVARAAKFSASEVGGGGKHRLDQSPTPLPIYTKNEYKHPHIPGE